MSTPVETGAAAALRRTFRGPVHRPGDADYDTQRRAVNPAFEAHLAVVAEATGPADVRAAVSWARTHGLPLAVQATGHGTHVPADGGVLIKTSRMATVLVDPVRRVAKVGPGARWGEVIAAAAPFGLIPLSGTSASVGVVGYTFGGGSVFCPRSCLAPGGSRPQADGFPRRRAGRSALAGLGPARLLSPAIGGRLGGLLSRRFGLAADSLVRADIVTADGDLVTATRERNADLFWAVRGGGGNFGVATSLEIRLFPATLVYAGVARFPIEHAAGALAFYGEWAAAEPDPAAHRQVPFSVTVNGPPESTAGIKPYTTGGSFLNFSHAPNNADAAFTPENVQRLREVKRDWDPDNVFHRNHNIKPAYHRANLAAAR